MVNGKSKNFACLNHNEKSRNETKNTVYKMIFFSDRKKIKKYIIRK